MQQHSTSCGNRALDTSNPDNMHQIPIVDSAKNSNGKQQKCMTLSLAKFKVDHLHPTAINTTTIQTTARFVVKRPK